MSESKNVLKHIVNIMAAVLFGAVAFVFIGYALNYKSLPFIADNFALLLSISGGVIMLLLTAFFVFYLLNKQALHRLIVCTLIFLDIFAIIFFTICATGIITKITSISALREYIGKFGHLAVLLYILFCFLQVIVLPVPGSATVAAGVALFGAFKCTIFSFIGIVLGSFAAFAIGRWIGYKAVKWIVGKDSLDKWLDKLKGKDYLILSIMFLLPLFPDDILCFVAGLSSMSWLYFSVMIVITRLISVVTTAYSIGFIPFNTWWGILIWIVIAALIVAAFYLVLKFSDKIDSFIKNKLKLKR